MSLGQAHASLLAAALAVCTPPAAGPGAARPARGAAAGPGAGVSLVELEVRPSAAAAVRYGARVEHVLRASERAIIERLSGLKTRHDPALSRMARELSRTAPDQVNIPPALIEGLMAWAGLVDPPPRLIVVEIERDEHRCAVRISPRCEEPVASIVEQVRATLPEEPEVPVGAGVVALPNGGARMVVAILERGARIDELPAATDKGGSVRVSGRLLGGRTRPKVELIDPRGHWSPVSTIIGDDGSFSGRLSCGSTAGRYQVEVLAEGRHGPEVVANFPLHCGTMPPDVLHVEVERLDSRVTEDQIARANFGYLNAAREQRGLPPIEWDEGAAKVARAHSKDMERNDFVGHRSPTSGDVARRFQRARIRGTVIRENVARGYGPKGIHDSLMRSPGHRVNILAEDVTHVGVGIVIAAPETNATDAPRPIFATQNFFHRPGAGGPREAELGPTLRGKVDAARSARGLPALAWDERLSKLALRQASAFARGRSPRWLQSYEKDVFALGYAAVERHRVESGEYTSLADLELWGKLRAVSVGVGVARTRARSGDDGGFLLVVLVASK